MKVKELIKQLKMLNPNFEVILSKDEEGNGYSPASSLVECDYTPENTWSGEAYFEDYEEEDSDYIFEPNAVILYPTN